MKKHNFDQVNFGQPTPCLNYTIKINFGYCIKKPFSNGQHLPTHSIFVLPILLTIIYRIKMTFFKTILKTKNEMLPQHNYLGKGSERQKSLCRKSKKEHQKSTNVQ